MIIANCISDFTTSYGLLVSLFLAGLIGGFTHCAGMCGPFVLAQTQNDFNLKRLRGILLLPYHLGRMMTYIGLAILFSSLINLAFLFSDARALVTALLLMLAGLLFLVSAFPAFGKIFPWVVQLPTKSPFGFISNLSGRLVASPGIFQKFILGILLGFMPCGLVISALMAAATATSPLKAGFAMAVFALGTMPALILVGLGGNIFKYKYPRLSLRFSQGAMTLSALWLFVLAGRLLF
jgi:hypothetical protein